jgi:ketosteroid isomerase-like protein
VSAENVQSVLLAFEAFRRRDDDALFAFYDPDIEWNMEGYMHWPGKQSYRGVEGIKEFFRDWLHDFDDYTSDALDPVDLGDRVLVTVHDRAQGKGSGVTIDRHHAQVWVFREGRVLRIEVWDTRESALAAHASAADRAP